MVAHMIQSKAQSCLFGKLTVGESGGGAKMAAT
jgi:hypothetical protein